MTRRLPRAPYLPAAVRVAVGAGAVAALVWGAASLPPTLDLAVAGGGDATPAAPTSLATSLSAMCPGNELSGIGGVGDVAVGGSVVAATGPLALLPVPATGSGSAALTAGSVPIAELAPARPAAASGALPRSGPVALVAQGSLAPAVVGAQEWVAATADLRGLVTTPCRSAGSDLWLLGGGDGPGRQERLVLVNPGGNPVTADVTVHGAAGRVGSSFTQTVAPGGRRTILLDAIAGEEALPAVHVVADGGGLHATLTDTWVSGSTPLGAETVVPTADPGTLQVVPAAVLGGGATLRVLAPGENQAVASVTILGRDGTVATTQDTVLTVGADAVAELALPEVPEGTYTVLVRSDVPVVASVRTQTGEGGTPGDIAWSGAAPVLDDVAGAALPATPSVARTLRLVSTGGATTARVTLVVGGEERTRAVDLLSERSADVDLAGASAVWVTRTGGSGALRGGIVATSGAGAGHLVSVVPLDPVAVTSPVSRAFPMP